MALDVWVQLLQAIARVLGTITAQMLILEKEVNSQVCLADNRGVLDCEVAGTGQHQVFEGFNTNHARARIHKQNV